jgi:hypothetical protein
MARYLLDWAKETTNTSGAGASYTLAGAVTNFETFVSRMTDEVGAGPWASDKVFYVCTDNAGLWEAGFGVLTDAASDTIGRTAADVMSGSSGAGVLVNWPTTDAKDIFSWIPGQVLSDLLWSEAFQTFTDADATPSVLNGKKYKTANTGATTITMFDDGVDGQDIFVVINDANTTIDFTGTNLKGNAGVDWTPGSGDTMHCVFDGTNWYCQVDNTS